MRLTMVPAVFVLGFWFILKLFNGVLSLGASEVGGVAFWAHTGGFMAGVAIAKLLTMRPEPERTIRW